MVVDVEDTTAGAGGGGGGGGGGGKLNSFDIVTVVAVDIVSMSV